MSAAHGKPSMAQHRPDGAEKTFGADDDARRCYTEAIGLTPSLLCNVGVVRRFLATFVGQRFYEALKRRLA